MSQGKRVPSKPFSIVWSRRAEEDLAAIGDYIAADNPAAAMRCVERQ